MRWRRAAERPGPALTDVLIAYDTDTRLLLEVDEPPDWFLLPHRTASRLQLLRPVEDAG